MYPGNLRQVYQAFRERWRIGEVIGYGEVNPLAAEIVVGMVPAWYVLSVLPAHERIAAAHLVGRRFGIFVPERAELAIQRGERVRRLRPMFPGYVFVFTWLSAANHHRLVSCPGVVGFLRRSSGAPAIVADAIIDAVRVEENKQQPLIVDKEGYHVMRLRKRGRRGYRKIVQEHQTIDDNQIVGVHTWSALRDELRHLDGNGPNRLLQEALGVV